MPNKRKKAWRSIDTQQIDDALEKETREERQGLRVDKLPDAELFVVDKTHDASALDTRPRKRRRELKPLRCETILAGAHKAKPVNPGNTKPRLKGPAVRREKPKMLVKAVGKLTEQPSPDVWARAEGGIKRKAAKRLRRTPKLFKAVEIDEPGCSYNPDPEQHQEAVAGAVATEMTKLYAEEMAGSPVKFLERTQADELEELLVAADESDEEEGEPATNGAATSTTPRRSEKKTRTDRNRDRRRRDAERAAAAKKALKKHRRDLQNVSQIRGEVEAEAAAEALRAARRDADRREAKASAPPRLGRHKFEPAPVQVLLSEEIGAGLRRLKGTPMLTQHRFKALQKTGVIEARKKVKTIKKPKRKRYRFTPGLTAEKLKASQEATTALVREGAKQRGPPPPGPRKGSRKQKRA